MKLKHLLIESKNIEMSELQTLIDSSKKPIFILVAGSVGSGKSFIVQKKLPHIDVIDPDAFTVELGGGVYDAKNVAKSIKMVNKAVADRLNNKQSFVQQGTSANLQASINKLKVAKENGFVTVLLYVDAPVEQAIASVKKRVASGGHGETIDAKKVENTSAGAKLTFRTLSGVDFHKTTSTDLQRVEQALDKTEKTIEKARKNLDYFIRVENKY